MAAKLPKVRIYAGFTDTHVGSKTIQGFMTMYETSECPAIMADASATLCRKSKMAVISGMLKLQDWTLTDWTLTDGCVSQN